MRYRADNRRKQMDMHRRQLAETREHERLRLARELHDTVAHHVTAIAIQAQAARAVAATSPEAVDQTLQAIEETASRTLGEMRNIVRVLRDDGQAEMAPQPRLVDIERLVQSSSGNLVVDVHIAKKLGELAPSVEAGLYRLAQESVVNAHRHAHNVRNIAVRIEDAGDNVRLTVTDDGDPVHTEAQTPSGYGLIGMRERVKLLGGQFAAGPGAETGWIVHAVLPQMGRSV